MRIIVNLLNSNENQKLVTFGSKIFKDITLVFKGEDKLMEFYGKNLKVKQENPSNSHFWWIVLIILILSVIGYFVYKYSNKQLEIEEPLTSTQVV